MEPIVYSIVKYKDEKDSFLWLIMQFTALVTVLAQGTINIDFNKTSGDLNRMFNECMGAGRANGGLRADWQQQFAYVRKKCGFKYI